MASDSRTNMVRSAASLMSARGVASTSFSDVLADSGAPRGSIYHHFPEGKQQLAEDAIRYTSERVIGYLRAGTETTPAAVLDHFVGLWRQVVVASNGAAGCVVAGVAVDSSPGDTALMAAVRETFRAWIEVLADQLAAAGLDAARARAVATVALAGMEGALILCRAEGGTGPLDIVGAELAALLS
jgi:TetR/AcrR family transcriptional repressor of lmrAB and yxaGH operons